MKFIGFTKVGGLLKWLDHYSLLSAFAVLALHHQFFRLMGLSPYDEGIRDYYFFAAGLLFFSTVLIYNTDHLLDRGMPIRWREAVPSLLAGGMSLIGITSLLTMGRGLWDAGFLIIGMGVVGLCGIHFLLFHTRLRVVFFPVKEFSVTVISVIGISYSTLYHQFVTGGIEFLNFIGMGVLFLVIFNNVLFYSWSRWGKDQQQGNRSLFHLLSFFQVRQFLRSLIFFSLIALLLLNPQGVSGASVYFIALVIVAGIGVQATRPPFPTENLRILSETAFLGLFPFFLW